MDEGGGGGGCGCVCDGFVTGNIVFTRLIVPDTEFISSLHA